MTTEILLKCEYDTYTAYYLNLVPSEDFFSAIEYSTDLVVQTFSNLPKHRYHNQYEKGKWTPLDLLQHMVDVERIFSYRILRFARNDTQSLPGFEVDHYAINAQAGNRTMSTLINEFEICRKASAALFSSFTEDMWLRSGQASGRHISVRALSFKLIGHDIHHCRILRERYFK